MMEWLYLRRLLRRMDWWLMLAMVLLMLAGVLFIYSATYQLEDMPISGMYRTQITWVAVGVALSFLVAIVDYHRLGDNATWLYGGCLILLVLVLFIGKRVYGAYRWLSFFGIQIQPSEFAKLGVIIALARFLSRPGRDLRQLKIVGYALMIAAVPFFLIVKEPDLGTAMVLVPITVGMLFVAGLPLRHLIIISILALLMLPVGWFALNPYQQERILVFFDASRDPLGAGWNRIQSVIAVGSGGMTGKGYLNGTQNVLGFLPRTVAPTDFIYSVIAEETGFVGSSLIMLMFLTVIIFCLRAAFRSRDEFGRLLATGIALMILCHVFINIAMTIGLMPITGLPLPMLSYGGSFMICTAVSLGIVQSVYVRRYRR